MGPATAAFRFAARCGGSAGPKSSAASSSAAFEGPATPVPLSGPLSGGLGCLVFCRCGGSAGPMEDMVESGDIENSVYPIALSSKSLLERLELLMSPDVRKPVDCSRANQTIWVTGERHNTSSSFQP